MQKLHFESSMIVNSETSHNDCSQTQSLRINELERSKGLIEIEAENFHRLMSLDN